MGYEIWIRDRYLDRIASITNFSKLELSMKFNDVGKWTLELPLEAQDSVQQLMDVRRQGGGIGGIIVTRDGNVIFSGPIRNMEISEDGTGSGDSTFVAYGTDDNGLLATRLAMPPRSSDGKYLAFAGTGAGYDVFTGTAEAAMLHLVEVNAGVDAEPSRAIYLLTTSEDGGRGSTITIRSRYHMLLEKLQEAALSGGLGFRVIQSFDDFFGIPILLFEVYSPHDITATVVFSKERRNLAGYRYDVEASEANFVIVGGGGESEARTFSYAGDEPARTLYGTVESFLDQRQTSDQTELLQALYNELEEKTEKTELEIQPLDVLGSQFMTDYNLGDKATVEVQGEPIQDVIRGVDITLSQDGETITPTVGTPGVGTSFRLFDNVRNLEARVGNLEKR